MACVRDLPVLDHVPGMTEMVRLLVTPVVLLMLLMRLLLVPSPALHGDVVDQCVVALPV